MTAYHAARIDRRDVERQLTSHYAGPERADFARRVRELDKLVLR